MCVMRARSASSDVVCIRDICVSSQLGVNITLTPCRWSSESRSLSPFDWCWSTMRVVSTFHPSSSVSRSLKCRLTLDAEYLVVAKTDKLEVHSLHPDGMKRECVVDMWGRVVGLQAIPAKVRALVALGGELCLGRHRV